MRTHTCTHIVAHILQHCHLQTIPLLLIWALLAEFVGLNLW